jgi:GNAT superfamily N-acetyltransferase
MERKTQVMDLWRTCFRDKERFVRLFFDNLYKDEQTLTLEKGGRVVSSLQMLPYAMTWRGGEIAVAYICGCSTSPEERGKGLMRKLLGQAHARLREKGFDMAALIPAEAGLFDYYRSLGYTEAFGYSLVTCHYTKDGEKENGSRLLPLDEDFPPEWFAFLNRKLRERPSCILHTRASMACNITDVRIDGGGLYGLRDAQGEPAGLAFAVPEDGHIHIKELLYQNEEARQSLLYKVANRYNVDKIVYRTLPCLPDPHRYGMAMVVNRDKMAGWREGYMSLMLD